MDFSVTELSKKKYYFSYGTEQIRYIVNYPVPKQAISRPKNFLQVLWNKLHQKNVSSVAYRPKASSLNLLIVAQVF
jgi:hypothetical protein